MGHSYGGGVALSVASLAPHRVEAVVLLASIGPGCVNRCDRLLAAPLVRPLCALVAWRLTPWIARARLAQIGWRCGRPPHPGRARQLASLEPSGPPAHPALAHVPDRATRPAARTGRAGACHPVPSSRRCSCSPTLRTPWFPSIPAAGSPVLCRTLAFSSCQAQVITCARRAPDAVADAIAAFLTAAQIADVPDHSASCDVNSSRVLSVLVGRGGPRASVDEFHQRVARRDRTNQPSSALHPDAIAPAHIRVCMYLQLCRACPGHVGGAAMKVRDHVPLGSAGLRAAITVPPQSRQTPVTLGQLFARLPEGGRSAGRWQVEHGSSRPGRQTFAAIRSCG